MCIDELYSLSFLVYHFSKQFVFNTVTLKTEEKGKSIWYNIKVFSLAVESHTAITDINIFHISQISRRKGCKMSLCQIMFFKMATGSLREFASLRDLLFHLLHYWLLPYFRFQGR